jgi:tetratricopeptide (TPR) repeat protein
MKIRIEELFDYCKQNGISIGNISESVMRASTEAALKGEDTFEVSDNTYKIIDQAHQKDQERQKQYNDISAYRLSGMKAEDNKDIDEAIEQYAKAIDTGEASDFDLLHAYRHAYDRIIILLSRTHAYAREAEYIEQLLKRHNLQDSDRTRLEERLRKTYIKISK